VGERASELGLPFRIETLELHEGPSFEARAREARYQALERMREAVSAEWIATAHTTEDQAETLLMRLMRGSATRGARGILPRAGRVIRPMLEVRRAEVEAFLADRGLSPVRDPMNRDRRFLRVRVREQLLPLLTELGGPEAVRHLAGFAGHAREDEALLSDQAAHARTRLSIEGGLEAVGLRALPTALRRRVLRSFLEDAERDPSSDQLAQAERAVLEGGSVELWRGVRLCAEGGQVRLAESAGPLTPVSLDQGGRARVGGYELKISASPPEHAWALSVEPAALPLTVRSRLPGDRVRVGAGEKKLQDFFVDAKVPREARDAHPVVVSREGTVLGVVPLWPRGNARRPGGVYLWAVEA
jgi:tRNA(Ile)-lysidine synthase